MPLRSNKEKESAKTSISTSRLTLLAMLLCCAIVIGYAESFIPLNFTVPGIKMGLANVVVLFTLYKFKPGEVFILVILKSIFASVFTASFAALVYSICGSLLSFTAMLLLIKASKGFFSPVGVSVIGAICHNIGQIMVATFFVGSFLVVAYLPVLLVSGVVTGFFVGLVVSFLLRNADLSKLFEEK